MTIEHLLMGFTATAFGWLLRHYGWFAGVAPTTPAKRSVSTAPATAAVAPTVRAEIDGIVREAVSTAMSAALADLRAATVPAAAK